MKRVIEDRDYVDGEVVARNTGELPHAILQTELASEAHSSTSSGHRIPRSSSRCPTCSLPSIDVRLGYWLLARHCRGDLNSADAIAADLGAHVLMSVLAALLWRHSCRKGLEKNKGCIVGVEAPARQGARSAHTGCM